MPGKYQVLISSNVSQAVPEPAKAGMPGDYPPPPSAKEPIPAKYNTKSELKADVTKAGPNKFDYELQAK